ncbi:hypothetical protein [Actinomadura litoris]|uniref:Lipoprotein n=1 Tax=Actinomadura litoris TaxID=2678616 RepID=A0A7K1KTP4_9ACTN|nr:hypothetical protein [Actinomadura litoris]MUN35568.1 hypothetical protein [Actinomadura litoris]
MRKIVMTGVAAALALGLTACGNVGDTKSAATPAAPTPPAAPTASQGPGGTSAPSGAATPGGASTPTTPGGSDAPTVRHSPLAQPGGKPAKEAWGRLRYVAPGKFSVGNVIFFTATDTVVYVAGGTCPDGTPPPADVSRCSVDGFDEWVRAAPHNAVVRFSGQAATMIRETQ